MALGRAVFSRRGAGQAAIEVQSAVSAVIVASPARTRVGGKLEHPSGFLSGRTVVESGSFWASAVSATERNCCTRNR